MNRKTINILREYISWLEEHPDELPKEFYVNILKKCLKEIEENND